MHKAIIVILEIGCLATSAVLAVLWIRNTNGPYEPYLALGAVLTAALELARRYMRSTKIRIFLSVGATYTLELENYVKELEALLATRGVECITPGRSRHYSRQPVLEVRDLMKSVDAIVVLAFPRFIVESGVGMPNANYGERETGEPNKPDIMKDVKYPTVWNQIEAGIAFGLGKPLLVIMTENIKREAMLQDRFEFKTIIAPVKVNAFSSVPFLGKLDDFLSHVRRRSWLRL